MTLVLLLALAWLLLPLPALVLVGRCMAAGERLPVAGERPFGTASLQR